MTITPSISTSFKKELMTATHNFAASGGNAFKLALFTSAVTLDASTTAYSTSNETTGTGYSAGGLALTNVDPATSGTTAYTTFSNISWTTSTFTARGCQIYNSTNSNKSVAVFDFGGDISCTAGTFAINFPTANSTTAVLRIA